MEAAYDAIGAGYDGWRRADVRIQRKLTAAIGDAARVLDVGTGTGNYSPRDRFCIGVDPSQVMLAARNSDLGTRSVQAVAEALPFDNGSFDCSLGVLTIHHWSDLHVGLEEMARTSSKQVLFMREPYRGPEDFWLLDYFPTILDVEAKRTYPTAMEVSRALNVTSAEDVSVPADCVDGFLGCYWNRPEAFLNDDVRRCISIFSFISDEDERRGVELLADDLESGRWDFNHGLPRSLDELWLGHRLVVADSAKQQIVVNR